MQSPALRSCSAIPAPDSMTPTPSGTHLEARAEHGGRGVDEVGQLLLEAGGGVGAVARGVNKLVAQPLPHAHGVQGVGHLLHAKLAGGLLGVPGGGGGGVWGLGGVGLGGGVGFGWGSRWKSILALRS